MMKIFRAGPHLSVKCLLGWWERGRAVGGIAWREGVREWVSVCMGELGKDFSQCLPLSPVHDTKNKGTAPNYLVELGNCFEPSTHQGILNKDFNFSFSKFRKSQVVRDGHVFCSLKYLQGFRNDYFDAACVAGGWWYVSSWSGISLLWRVINAKISN